MIRISTLAARGQGIADPILATTHLGILNSPDTRKATLEFLRPSPHRDGHSDHDRGADRD